MDPKCKKAYTGVHESATSLLAQLGQVAAVKRKHAETLEWLKSFKVKEEKGAPKHAAATSVSVPVEELPRLQEHYESILELCESLGSHASAVPDKLDVIQKWLGPAKLDGEADATSAGFERRIRLLRSAGGTYEAQKLPVWMPMEESPPPLCGNVPLPDKQRLLSNDLVAAKTSKPREHPSWIMCKIVMPKGEDSYVVEDISPSPEEDPSSYRYTLDRTCLVPMSKSEPRIYDERTEFPSGHRVMALFPGTTSFYQAIVVKPPSQVDGEVYQLRFEDDEDDRGTTPTRDILPQWVLRSSEK